MRTIKIRAGKGYEVQIGAGLLAQAGEKSLAVSKAKKVLLVSDDIVYPLYGEKVVKSFTDAGAEVIPFVFPHGEASKNLETYGQILEAACEARLTRSDMIAALGGGVAGDMAGFAAATYQRGTGFAQIPTTLLACIDSSVGGKTAIDLKNGKNQAGAFYQPQIVIIDPEVLETLPEIEYRNGCAEIIKTAVLDGEELFEKIRKTPVREQYEDIIAYCVDFKRKYVEEDEFDLGLRMKLNLGHTIGHAIEACSDYTVPHGQAVAAGLAAISRAAAELGYLAPADSQRILDLIEAYGLPMTLDDAEEDLFRAASADKKNSGDTMRIIVPRAIGDCVIETIPREQFHRWLSAGGAGK